MNGKVTVAILAGGRSQRMGSDKSFISFNGRPLIEHVIERVTALALPIILVANNPEPYLPLNLPLFTDIVPDKGSLGGLYTALSHSQTDYTLCVACDMPFLSPALLQYIITLRKGFDAVIPQADGCSQGLHAIYHIACLSPMLRALQQDRLKISTFLSEIRVHFVEETEVRRFDPELRSFVNLNSPQELHQAEMGNRVQKMDSLA
ncbi:MAG: molybdenum cofactor guanylyltransferase [Chloroflexota bacterium]